jgi:hypothetical protein
MVTFKSIKLSPKHKNVKLAQLPYDDIQYSHLLPDRPARVEQEEIVAHQTKHAWPVKEKQS